MAVRVVEAERDGEVGCAGRLDFAERVLGAGSGLMPTRAASFLRASQPAPWSMTSHAATALARHVRTVLLHCVTGFSFRVRSWR